MLNIENCLNTLRRLGDALLCERLFKLSAIERWPKLSEQIGRGPAHIGFHDNRGAAPSLAEAGATAPEIADAMCWTVDKAAKDINTYLARWRTAVCWRRTP
jgi:hypothetical protein